MVEKAHWEFLELLISCSVGYSLRVMWISVFFCPFFTLKIACSVWYGNISSFEDQFLCVIADFISISSWNGPCTFLFNFPYLVIRSFIEIFEMPLKNVSMSDFSEWEMGKSIVKQDSTKIKENKPIEYVKTTPPPKGKSKKQKRNTSGHAVIQFELARLLLFMHISSHTNRKSEVIHANGEAWAQALKLNYLVEVWKKYVKRLWNMEITNIF